MVVYHRHHHNKRFIEKGIKLNDRKMSREGMDVELARDSKGCWITLRKEGKEEFVSNTGCPLPLLVEGRFYPALFYCTGSYFILFISKN